MEGSHERCETYYKLYCDFLWVSAYDECQNERQIDNYEDIFVDIIVLLGSCHKSMLVK